jgi:hypothetical protein
LPGQCWEDREAKLVDRIGQSSNFMRAAGARAGGIDVGVALPVMRTEHELHSVILMLSSDRSPIAKVLEIWSIDDGSESMMLKSSAYIDCGAIELDSRDMRYGPGEGVVGKTWLTGLPYVTKEFGAVDQKRRASARADELTTAIAFPVYVGEVLKSVFVMLN